MLPRERLIVPRLAIDSNYVIKAYPKLNHIENQSVKSTFSLNNHYVSAYFWVNSLSNSAYLLMQDAIDSNRTKIKRH